MSAQAVQARRREFKFLIGFHGYDTVGLAYEVAVVVCQTQTNFLLLTCHVEQCNLEQVTRFLEILFGIGFECCILLRRYSHHHLGKIHLLGIEVALSATEHGTGIAVLLIHIDTFERIGTVCYNLYLIERLQVHHLVDIRDGSLFEITVQARLEALYAIWHSAYGIEFIRCKFLHLVRTELYRLVVTWLIEYRSIV